MKRGYLALLLHAHLPYVRHPEYKSFFEESWLFEAITETYLPLLGVFNRLHDDGIPYRVTLSFSPTLAAMLRDELLLERYRAHLVKLIELAGREVLRTRGDRRFNPLAKMYRRLFEESLDQFENRYRGDLLAAFAELRGAGRLELITASATHGFLPLLSSEPTAVRAQLQVAAEHFTEQFGEPASGVWLPECGYYPGLEEAVAEAGFRWFTLDTHGILNASERPWHGIAAPLACPNGVAAFGRDPDATRQVWSATEGYPGDPWYREFHRDIGFELDFDYVGPYLPGGGARVHTGIKYCRVTNRGETKASYRPERALERVHAHADHFLDQRRASLDHYAARMERPPLLVAPYDAELFGHWWFEGPLWLERVIRRAHERWGEDAAGVELISPGDYLGRHRLLQCAQPSASSWGELGYNAFWLNENNHWVYPYLHRAARSMAEMARKHRDEAVGTRRHRALRQAARSLLLAQASDWPFLLKAGTGTEYAERRLRDYLARFAHLEREISNDEIDGRSLRALEQLDPIFPNIDYRLFATGSTP
ncbi:glycoside hydrolase family 57 protein [Endothiovibrio diazotrophicus]